jgi:hypothetical protein
LIHRLAMPRGNSSKIFQSQNLLIRGKKIRTAIIVTKITNKNL